MFSYFITGRVYKICKQRDCSSVNVVFTIYKCTGTHILYKGVFLSNMDR